MFGLIVETHAPVAARQLDLYQGAIRSLGIVCHIRSRKEGEVESVCCDSLTDAANQVPIRCEPASNSSSKAVMTL